MTKYYQYAPGRLDAGQLAELHQLPDEALVTAQEAAEVLRIKYTTLAFYRCHGGGPEFVRVGTKVVRYRMGALREYAKGQPMGAGMRRVGAAMLAGRAAKREE